MTAIIESRDRPILFGAAMVRAVLDGTKTQTRRVVTKPITPNRYSPLEGALHRPDLPDDAMLMHCGKGRIATQYDDWERECPYGLVGDRLYVRETHAQFEVGGDKGCGVAYRATCPGDAFDYVRDDGSLMNLRVTKWTPAIHMPRWASRITLEITDVRVQRLQAISGEDARAEGVQYPVSTEGCAPGTCQPLFALADGVIDRAIEWGICSTSKKPAERDPTHDDMSRLYFARLWDSINGKRPGCSWRDNPWLFAISFKRIGATP